MFQSALFIMKNQQGKTNICYPLAFMAQLGHVFITNINQL